MKTFKKIIIGAGILITGFTFYGVSKNDINVRVGPEYLYPTYPATNGKVETSDYYDLTREWSGKSYSEAHRRITQKTKNEVCYIYKCEGEFQYDHAVPLCLGGANTADNLWAQPKVNMWNGKNYGWKEKDRLDTYLCLEMKAQRMTPKEAQDLIGKDWVRAYRRYIEGKQKFMGEDFDDGEDEIITN